MENITIEACVETLDQAVDAMSKGAHQLEICSNLSEEGLTPVESILVEILSKVRIPCKVMIRSRPGNYFYQHDEINQMVSQINQYKSYGIEGFVFGALKKDNKGCNVLDMKAIYQICKASFPINVTIHKAIDQCDDIISQIKRLKQVSNIKFILSSGGSKDAYIGAEYLKKMQIEGGNQIQIIGAGKITPENIEDIIAASKLQYLHGRNIV